MSETRNRLTSLTPSSAPCAPGAGYLSNPCPDGPKTYCFGHDWFENDVAPYPVYRVDTGELVPPPVK